jgi:O-antigen/teichoic acid export membrane protein
MEYERWPAPDAYVHATTPWWRASAHHHPNRRCPDEPAKRRGGVHMLKLRVTDQAFVARFGVIRNISANWIGLFTVLVVGFFLTPFILHNLGAVAFGLWVLMTTVTGYYGLLDFGIRNAVCRYAARFHVAEDADASRIASTAFFTYAMLGAVVLILTFLAAWKLQDLMRVPDEWVATAKQLLLVVGIGTALGFPLSVFGGVLEGQRQFAWVAGVQSVGAVIRATLIVIALKLGYGLLTVGIITVGVSVAASLVYVFVAFAVCPQMRLRWQYVDRGTLRILGSFGLVTFWIAIALKLRLEADALVIGAFVAVEAIAVFAIASRLVTYTIEIVQNLAQVFTPVFSYLDATGDRLQLQRALVIGNRYSSLVAFPLGAVLIVMGKSIIEAWVGAPYLASYALLVTLMIPMTLYLAQAASTKVLYGMAKHRTLAWVFLVEGIANLGLSILLLRRYGLLGVALGTAIPLAITSVVFLPVHTCKAVGLPVVKYLREAHLAPVQLAVTFGACLWVAGRWVHAGTYAGVVLQFSIGAGLCALAVLGYQYVTGRSARLQSPSDHEIIQPVAPV